MPSQSSSDEDVHMDFHAATSAPAWGEPSNSPSTQRHLELSPRFAGLLKYVDSPQDENPDDSIPKKYQVQALVNAPIFTAEAYNVIDGVLANAASTTDPVPQYGLIGMNQHDAKGADTQGNSLVLANLNMPWSTFICGSQGAGKSHTLSCLLESSLVPGNDAGELPHPLAGLVMHYDNYTSYNATQYCEAAYLCSSGIPVTVLVCPSNIWAMSRLYSNLPGLVPGGPRPKVVPLYLSEDSLNISRMLKLMAVDTSSAQTPMYMEVVMGIIREMAMEGRPFMYSTFLQRIGSVVWAPGQRVPLDLRLQMLDTFLAPSALTKSTRPAQASESIWSFEPGTMTIVDLSDPMVSSDDACSLFSICLSIFLETRAECGRVVALDEAHKFLSQSGEAATLMNELTSIIRQQRHTGTRVVIATQEPTLSPELLDLANVTFVHRFLSPAWYEILKKHLAGADRQDHGGGTSLFHQIVGLRTGEALLFCPTARVATRPAAQDDGETTALGSGFMRVKIRNRLTTDGGESIMSTDFASRVSVQTPLIEVPMHVVTASKPSTSQAVKENTTMSIGDSQMMEKGPGNPHPRKEAVLTNARELIRKNFRAQPHIWTKWEKVPPFRKKSLWDELEAGLGVANGFYQNNLQYKLMINAAMAECLEDLHDV